MRIPPHELVDMWRQYRRYHSHRVRLCDFLADQDRARRIMDAVVESLERKGYLR